MNAHKKLLHILQVLVTGPTFPISATGHKKQNFIKGKRSSDDDQVGHTVDVKNVPWNHNKAAVPAGDIAYSVLE